MHPVDEAAHEFAVVMRVAGGEVEGAVHADGLDRAGGDAELAIEAGRVVERLGQRVDFAVDDDGAEQDEAAETRMDDVAVEAHLSEAGRLRDRLVGNDAHAGRIGLRFHREGGGGIDRAEAHFFQPAHGFPRNMIHIVISLVEFLVRDRADGGAHSVSVHPDDEADERFRAGEERADPCLLVCDGGIGNRDEAAIVRAAVEHQVAEEGGRERAVVPDSLPGAIARHIGVLVRACRQIVCHVHLPRLRMLSVYTLKEAKSRRGTRP